MVTGCSLFEDEVEKKFIEKSWGETFQCEGVDVTLNYYTFCREMLYTFSAGDGKMWIEINATLTNNSTETIHLSDINDGIIYVTDDGEAKYNSMWFSYLDFINSHNSLLPFESITGIFSYKVPDTIVPQDYYNYNKIRETKNVGFEFRMEKNSIYAEECFIVKL